MDTRIYRRDVLDLNQDENITDFIKYQDHGYYSATEDTVIFHTSVRPDHTYRTGVNFYDKGVINGYDLNVSDKENLESQYERLLFWEPLDETPTRTNILFKHREINAEIAKKIDLLTIKLYDDSNITNYQRFENSNHNLFYYFSKFYIFMGEIFFITKESITILQLWLFNGILFLLLPFPLYLKIRFVIGLKAEEISNAIKQKVNLIWNKYF